MGFINTYFVLLEPENVCHRCCMDCFCVVPKPLLEDTVFLFSQVRFVTATLG